jgi:hypothetical protein
MDKEPKLLVWNYTSEEKERLDTLLKEIGAPSAATIDSNQGHFPLREIIHTNAHGRDHLESEAKVSKVPPMRVCPCHEAILLNCFTMITLQHVENRQGLCVTRMRKAHIPAPHTIIGSRKKQRARPR